MTYKKLLISTIKIMAALIIMPFAEHAYSTAAERTPIKINEKEKEMLQEMTCRKSEGNAVDFIEADTASDSEKPIDIIANVSCLPKRKIDNFDVRERYICDNFTGSWACTSGYSDIYANIAGREMVLSAESANIEKSLYAIYYLDKNKKLKKLLDDKEQKYVCKTRQPNERTLNVECQKGIGFRVNYKVKNGNYRFSRPTEYLIFL